MSQLTLLDTDYATLWYYPEGKIVRHQFNKFIHGEHFRGVLETGLQALQQHGAAKWLSDDRRNSAIPTSDLTWTFEDWSPRCIQAGWKHWAVIMPTKTGGQMTMERTIKQYAEMGVEVQIFDDPDEALAWLESIP